MYMKSLQGLALFPLKVVKAWTVRTGTSWHSRVIVAKTEESASQAES